VHRWQRCLLNRGILEHHIWRLDPHLTLAYPPAVLLFICCRCWDLSAGSLKWIYQVPILAAIVVSLIPAAGPFFPAE